VALLIARAIRTPGLLDEDRRTILEQASALAAEYVHRYSNNKAILAAYCEVGLEIARLTGNYSVYDVAIGELKSAEERIGDPDISRLVARFEARLKGRELEGGADDDL